MTKDDFEVPPEPASKDEMWQAFMDALTALTGPEFDCTCIPDDGYECDYCRTVRTASAYAQAAVDAALEIERNTIIVQEANHDEGQYEEDADTLGMLEVLAKRYGYARTKIGERDFIVAKATDSLHYHYVLGRQASGISRAEAEALLGEGKEKKRWPTTREVGGSDPDFTGGMSTKEFIDEIRGEVEDYADADA